MERSTRQREAIYAAIEAAGRPLSPQEVLDAARQVVPTLGIATVYRNLKLLLDEGMIEVVALPGGGPRYEAAGQAHHHHFQCSECHRVFDIPDYPGDLSSLAPPGFTVASHDITLYGRCRDCQPSSVRKGKKAPAARSGGRREA